MKTWITTINERRPPANGTRFSALKLGVLPIKNSRLHGASYAKVQVGCRGYFTELNAYNKTDRVDVKAANQLYNSWMTIAINRYRAALNRGQK